MAEIESYVNFERSLLPLALMDELISQNRARDYQENEPFPHTVIDNFFDPSIVDRVLSEFPSARDIDWEEYDSFEEVKLATGSELQIKPFTRYLIYSLNSSTFINFLETLTGISGLIADPHLSGGGLHQIMPGGKLGMHVDFNRYTRLSLDRRINLLLYLNKDWEEAFGGHVEFWDREMKNSIVSVLPIFNRIVIFNTTSSSYHGHPNPLMCPEGCTRKSLALYYYSNGRPEEEIRTEHSTLFQLRPNESRSLSLKQQVKRFVPPVLYEIRDWFRKSKNNLDDGK